MSTALRMRQSAAVIIVLCTYQCTESWLYFVRDMYTHTQLFWILVRTPARFNPRGKALASEVEEIFDFLRRELTPEARKQKKGPRVGSSGRELGYCKKMWQRK